MIWTNNAIFECWFDILSQKINFMKKINLWIVAFMMFIFILTSQKTAAQEFGFGLKLGVNYSTLLGKLEQDNSGKNLERLTYQVGFHVAATSDLKLTEDFGVRAELTYSKKNHIYQYDGQAFRIYPVGNTKIYATGILKTNILRTNSYIEVPINAYYRVGRKIELSAGGYVSALIYSKASGDVTFSGTTAAGSPIAATTLLVDYNYFSDKPRAGKGTESPVTFFADGLNVSQPKTLGAYYDYDKKEGNFFKTIDYGLTAGISYFFNKSLYFNFRAQYGLADITNNFYDFQQATSNGLTPTPRQDKDTNLTLQASVGFTF